MISFFYSLLKINLSQEAMVPNLPSFSQEAALEDRIQRLVATPTETQPQLCAVIACAFGDGCLRARRKRQLLGVVPSRTSRIPQVRGGSERCMRGTRFPFARQRGLWLLRTKRKRMAVPKLKRGARRLLEAALVQQRAPWDVGRRRGRIWHPSGSNLAGCDDRTPHTSNFRSPGRQPRACPVSSGR
jgi:hypothetical protein